MHMNLKFKQQNCKEQVLTVFLWVNKYKEYILKQKEGNPKLTESTHGLYKEEPKRKKTRQQATHKYTHQTSAMPPKNSVTAQPKQKIQ